MLICRSYISHDATGQHLSFLANSCVFKNPTLYAYIIALMLTNAKIGAGLSIAAFQN